jgi:hypothetical protein
MVSIPHDREQAQPGQQDFIVQLQYAREQIQLLKRENRELHRELQWQKQLDRVPNTILSTGHRTTLRVTMRHLQGKDSNEEGYYHLELWKIAKDSGQAAGTVGKHIRYFAERAHLFERREIKVADGATATGYREEIWVKPDVALIATPSRYSVNKERNHGGDRKTCPCCKSKRVRKKTTYTCMDCGTVFDEKIIDSPATTDSQNQVDPTAGKDHHVTNLMTKENQKSSNQVDQEEKPVSPPVSEASEEQHSLIALFLDIAGDHPEHIQMSRGEKKYVTIKRTVTAQDIKEHLTGRKTIGAKLSHPDGTTRVLCFDADTPEAWQTLQEAALTLSAAGYTPLLEPSPADRGGHLWIIFSERVSAKGAYAHVCDLAPLLREINEYWPGKGNQKVRLPAGKYVSATITAWCHLEDAWGAEITTHNLPDYLTPAELVPVFFPFEENEETACQAGQVSQEVKAEPAGVDSYWQQKYGQSNLWFAWTPAQLAEWYNSKTTVTELLPPERNGNGLAQWRGERTASVVYRGDTAWVDFGATARREDGKPDGGDCLELATRIQERPKAETMREAARQLFQEARQALETAAMIGGGIPTWLLPYLTKAGWRHYEKLRERAAGRGLAGFSQRPRTDTSFEEDTAQQHGFSQEEQSECLPAGENAETQDDLCIETCSLCERETEYFSADGTAYCSRHYPTPEKEEKPNNGKRKPATGQTEFLPKSCSCCRRPAIWWKDRIGYCEQHGDMPWYMQETE